MIKRPKLRDRLLAIFACAFVLASTVPVAVGQAARSAKVAAGSAIAKAGFRNEDEIRDKFNNWQLDGDARKWLGAMNYDLASIEDVIAGKPHGQKADVEIRVLTKAGEKVEGISIKLVSSPNGFNQIDKRWLTTYAKKWKMPPDVVTALKYFVGELPPLKTAGRSLRSEDRMYLNELEPTQLDAILAFFTANKDEIVSDLIVGDGTHSAGWMMVALKATENTRWVIKSSAEAARFFGDGKVEITRAGNLRIGRITMQRKGGDGGRETARMLQFKINPVQLFDAK